MITILIPAYNEEEVIQKSIETVSSSLDLDEEFELLIVNDGSSDSTARIVSSLQYTYPNLRLVNHVQNGGLGAALQTGFREAQGRIVVTMDADLTHPASLVRTMVEECENADAVIASRYVGDGGMQNVPFWRVALSKSANIFFQLLLATRVRDVTAGFRAYRKEALENLRCHYNGFEIQLSLTAQLIRQGKKIKEVPYTLVNREIGVSKFNLMKSLPKYAAYILDIWFARWFW